VGFFRFALRPVSHRPHLAAVFPGRETFESHVPEAVLDRLVLPSTSAVARGLYWMRWIQRGSVHRYLLYILVTLLLLFMWK
jgi:hypothetical protein